ncbi:MAG: SPOR domain-containing protein [Chlorobiaceae bacterium]
MFSDKTIYLIRKNTAPLLVAFSVALSYPQVLQAADEHSYAQEIQQDVAEDKVYLLENIRQKATIPAEKTILEALFCEDAPQAVMLFQKQLREYPDPALDKLSSSRIAAYNLALNRTTTPLKTSRPLTATKAQPIAVKEDSTRQSSKLRSSALLPSLEASKESKIVAGPTTCTLQFGSFENRKNAEKLASKISQYVTVDIVKKGQVYKVLLNNNYASKEDASTAAKKLPVKAIVVPSI